MKLGTNGEIEITSAMKTLNPSPQKTSQVIKNIAQRLDSCRFACQEAEHTGRQKANGISPKRSTLVLRSLCARRMRSAAGEGLSNVNAL
jgi:hypothetical protein